MSAPLVIAGVGGSGTRVIAATLQRAGLYIGGDLNESYDNLWFTLLLRRPVWLQRQIGRGASGRREIDRYISLFLAAASGTLRVTHRELMDLGRAAVHAAHHHYRGTWSVGRSWSILTLGNNGPYDLWGWKEPNSILFLDRIAKQLPTLRYIHLTRHGFDMAVKENMRELALWSDYLGIPHEIPEVRRSFLVWADLNRRALEAPVERLVVAFEDLCASPADEIERILDFAGLDGAADELASFVRRPGSLGRWRGQGHLFTADDRRTLKEFGYDAD